MIKYTTNDIIKRAEQLADLENSDFISDYEKLALLNESWQIIYQKIINANDKSFLKWTRVCDGMCLPSDLYQIAAVYVDKTHTQIPKMNISQRHGYEIVNNRIYLSDDCRDTTVVMDYFPIPKTLKLKEKTIDAPFTSEVLTTSRNIYATKDGDDLIIKDLDSDFEYNLGTVTYNDIALYSNGLLIDATTGFKVFSFANSRIGNIPADLIPAIYGNTIYFFNKTSKQVVDLAYNIYLPKLDIELDDSCYIIYFDDLVTYQICPDYYICNDNKVEIAERSLKGILSEGHELCVVSQLGKVWRLKKDKVEIVETEYPAVCMCNDKYVVTKRLFGNKQFLEGYSSDTELLYPNNLYYVVISYMLAIQFKVKQSADTTELQRMYEVAQNQLYSSLSNDANDVYQMKNVYSNNPWRF